MGRAGARFGLFWTVETRTTPPGRRGKVVGGDWEGGRWSHLTHLALGRPLCAAPAPPRRPLVSFFYFMYIIMDSIPISFRLYGVNVL